MKTGWFVDSHTSHSYFLKWFGFPVFPRHGTLCGLFRNTTERFVVYSKHHRALCGIFKTPQSTLWRFTWGVTVKSGWFVDSHTSHSYFLKWFGFPVFCTTERFVAYSKHHIYSVLWPIQNTTERFVAYSKRYRALCGGFIWGLTLKTGLFVDWHTSYSCFLKWFGFHKFPHHKVFYGLFKRPQTFCALKKNITKEFVAFVYRLLVGQEI